MSTPSSHYQMGFQSERPPRGLNACIKKCLYLCTYILHTTRIRQQTNKFYHADGTASPTSWGRGLEGTPLLPPSLRGLRWGTSSTPRDACGGVRTAFVTSGSRRKHKRTLQPASPTSNRLLWRGTPKGWHCRYPGAAVDTLPRGTGQVVASESVY